MPPLPESKELDLKATSSPLDSNSINLNYTMGFIKIRTAHNVFHHWYVYYSLSHLDFPRDIPQFSINSNSTHQFLSLKALELFLIPSSSPTPCPIQ